MRSGIIRKRQRGTTDHGWLHANFSFSFESYYHPDIAQLGMPHVLNNVIIFSRADIGTHPHDNTEIIIIPLESGLTEVFDAAQTINYDLKIPGNGICLFLIHREHKLNNEPSEYVMH